MDKARIAFLSTIGMLLLAVFLWGLAPVANRYLLMSLSPLNLAVIRFLVASLLFVPIALRTRKQRWTRADLLRAALCGLASILGYNVIVTFGLAWVPASVGGLLVATSPLWIALLAWIFERESVRWNVVLGLLLGIGGIVSLVGWTALLPAQSPSLIQGMGLVLFAALMWGIYTVAVRPLSARYGAPVSTAVTTIIGTLPLLGFWNERLLSPFTHFSDLDWLAFLLLALGSTVIATVLWNYAVARLPSARAGVFLNLVPVVSMGGAGLFLGEQITLTMLLSGLVIIVGVVVTQLPALRRAPVEPGKQDIAVAEPVLENE